MLRARLATGLAALLCAGLIAAGCGDDDEPSTVTTPTVPTVSIPNTVTTPGGDQVTIPKETKDTARKQCLESVKRLPAGPARSQAQQACENIR